jgi:Ricin-type beta-trefoil lectin domain
VAGSGLVMDVYGYGETNGTRVDVYPSNGQWNQEWNLASAQILGMGDECLDDSAYGGEGSRVDIYACHGSQNQVWNYDNWSQEIFGYDGNCLQASGLPIGTGVVMNACDQAGETWQILPGGLIKNLDTEKCIDLPNWDFNNSTDVILTTCNPALTSQKFAWKGNITTPIDNACLDLQAGNTSDGTPIQMWSCLANDLNQDWYFSP